jgi:hypothetical protein
MIQVTFAETEVRFASNATKKQHVIRYAEHPDVFGHPRHLMVNLESAQDLLREALKAVHGGMLPPKVEVRVRRHLAGGLADVDRRTLKDFFVQAGARDVALEIDTQ